MKTSWRPLGTLLVLALTCGAIWLLIREISHYSLADIQTSLARIPRPCLAASLGLMILNYLILVGYDGLALKAIRKPLPLRRTMLVSFVGCVISFNFGALLGGGSARFRFYSLWGFSLADILRLVAMLALTFWIGAFGLAGIVFLIEPVPLPEFLRIPQESLHVLAVLLLLGTIGYLTMCVFWRKPLTLKGESFTLPTPKIALAQILVAWADLFVAASCLFVLMPSDLGVDFIQFLSLYLLAMVAVVVSHVPGGTGLFELIILGASPTTHPQAVIAALLCFRVIYYFLPLLVVAGIILVHEIRLRFPARA